MKRYFFPDHGISVEANSYEEALGKITDEAEPKEKKSASRKSSPTR